MTCEGYCNRGVFTRWLEHFLLPNLELGVVVICDHATFYKGGRIEALVEQAAFCLLYHPIGLT